MPRQAFTLIELLIVIAIIGILTGLATISYSGVQQRGRDAQRKNDLAQIKISLSSYYNAHVPAQYVVSQASPVANGNNATISINSTSDLLSVALEPAYMSNVPTDPTGAYSYQYQSISTNSLQKGYKLFATLENKNDNKGWGGGNGWVVNGFIVQNE